MRRLALIITGMLIFLISAFFVFSQSAAPAVKVPPEPPEKIFDIAENESRLFAWLKKNSVKAAMSELVAESSGGEVKDCHQEAHNIGRIGYKIYKEKAFGQCDASCHSGCYHGAMESFLNEKGTQNLAANIERVCSLFQTSFSIFECLHGVGHGVLAYLDYDMPAGIQMCKKLSTWFAQDSCYGGIFMENILTAQGLGASKKKEHETKWANRTDALFPCNAIGDDFHVLQQCYLMQTSWMLTMNKYDFDVVAKECRRAPENLIPVCYKSFGRDAGGHTLRNVPKIIEICNKVPREKDFFEQCAIGAVNVIADFWGPGLRDQATELCRAFAEPAKGACYHTLGSRLPDIFGGDNSLQKQVCDGFEEDYQEFCRAAKNSTNPSSLLKPQETAAKPSSGASVLQVEPIRITMNDEKFEPAKITVARGQVVEFYNADTELHWPASNIHPSHAIYPEFDPKGPVQPRTSWKFTFNQAGEWRFHDHLFPSVTGMVVVQ